MVRLVRLLTLPLAAALFLPAAPLGARPLAHLSDSFEEPDAVPPGETRRIAGNPVTDGAIIAQAPDADEPDTLPPPAPRVLLWWWLLPAGLIGILIWALLGRRSDDNSADNTGPTADVPHGQPLEEPERSTTATVDDISPAVETPANAAVPGRAQTVVSADRDQPLELGAMEAAGLGAAVDATGPAGSAIAGAAAGAELSAKLYGQTEDDVPAEVPGIAPEPMADLVSEVFPETARLDAAGDAAEEADSPQQTGDAVRAGAIAAGLAAAAQANTAPPAPTPDSTAVQPAKAIGETPPPDATATTDQSTPAEPKLSNRSSLDMATLSTVDDGLPELPDGYDESRIVLMPRDPQWAYAYWDVPNAHKEALRNQGGRDLALRLYDVSNVDMDTQAPHNLQQYYADEMARSWYVPIPVSDRDYIAEIGYLTSDGGWLVLARSAPAHIPPVFPSDWVEDQFLTLSWADDLRGKTFVTLIPPGMARPTAAGESPLHDAIFARAGDTNALRVAGSLFGSMQQVPASVLSSFAIPSGLTELPGVPGAPVPNVSGLNMSGLNMSGVGFSADFVPPRPRQFWLVADAELIVYGATEPDAAVTIGGQQIELSPDGTFRFHMSFQDGELDFPIQAVASDGEQMRKVEMDFKRETPRRNTNTKDDMNLEWFE